jgi:hypothetical protein
MNNNQNMSFVVIKTIIPAIQRLFRIRMFEILDKLKFCRGYASRHSFI